MLTRVFVVAGRRGSFLIRPCMLQGFDQAVGVTATVVGLLNTYVMYAYEPDLEYRLKYNDHATRICLGLPYQNSFIRMHILKSARSPDDEAGPPAITQEALQVRWEHAWCVGICHYDAYYMSKMTLPNACDLTAKWAVIVPSQYIDAYNATNIYHV